MELKDVTLDKDSIVNYLQAKYTEDGLIGSVDDCMSDYLDDGWDEEYDDEYEAYQETGRGEAEAQVRTSIEKEILEHLKIDYFDFDDQMGETISDIILEVFPVLDKD